MRNTRLTFVAAIVAGWLAGSLPACAQPETKAPPAAAENSSAAKPRSDDGASPAAEAPSPAEIATWLAKLDAGQYRVREQATLGLLAAGPAALEAVAVVANSDRPEPADRAVWLLQQFANSKEPPFQRQALERLVQLRDRPHVVAAAANALALIHHQEARQAIEKLGGRFLQQEVVGVDPRVIPQVLILDDHWKGKREDLEQIGYVLGLRDVFIIGTELDASDVAELRQVPALTSLRLYGTRLTPSDLDDLKTQFPQATIDYRRGALLGVSGSAFDDGRPATAERVQPGSAADAAGIKAGDEIHKFDGQQVKNFKSLTDMISSHNAGDEVPMEIVRNGAKKSVTVKLGRWQTENVVKQLNGE